MKKKETCKTKANIFEKYVVDSSAFLKMNSPKMF